MSKLAIFIDEAQKDVLARMHLPTARRTKSHSTNRIEQSNGEITQHANVVGTFPTEEAIVCLAGDILLEQNDEWAVQRVLHDAGNHRPLSDNAVVSLSATPP